MSNPQLEEWKEARAVLSRFDGYLADLRKYGFIFLAALLAADSVQALFKLGEETRFALILITIAFIVALQLLDHNYQQYERAASIRAMILERILNIELTETIAYRYKRKRLYLYILLLYIGFVAIADGLGFVILSTAYWFWLIVAAIVGIGIIVFISITLTPNLQLHNHIRADWTIDKMSCEKGEQVRITITNLDEKKNINFKLGDIVCQIKDEEGNLTDTLQAGSDISIPGNGNYSLLWDTRKLNIRREKIYRIWPREWNTPMRRSILVCKHKPTKPKTQG